MYEIERWISVAVLGVLWLKFAAYNVFFALDRIHRRSFEGPSALPMVGTISGIAALLLAPVDPLAFRLLFIPLALIPDLAMPAADRLVARLGKPSRKRSE